MTEWQRRVLWGAVAFLALGGAAILGAACEADPDGLACPQESKVQLRLDRSDPREEVFTLDLGECSVDDSSDVARDVLALLDTDRDAVAELAAELQRASPEAVAQLRKDLGEADPASLSPDAQRLLDALGDEVEAAPDPPASESSTTVSTTTTSPTTTEG